LYSTEAEADDKWHMPADDDDIVYKPTWKEFLEPRSLISAIGGTFLILGLLCVFVLLPVLTFRTNLVLKVGVTSSGGINYGPAWAHVNNNTYPLLQNVRKGLIDPQTPTAAYTRASTFNDSTLHLVFSDEFNDDNRTFYPGDDPFWFGTNLWYGSTQDLEWYDPDAVTTSGGTLQLRLDAFPNHNLQYRSGMVNSWNQLCFKGGVFEVSVSLAGPAGVPGLWPGVWSMGNLGRPGYRATTDGVWPYTYNSCDVGITPNQSSSDGLSFLPGQKLPSCTCTGADHPSPGTGRGAPEIDILEASVDPNNRIGVVTQSYQVAPFDIFYRPNSDFMQIPNFETTQMNTYCGGPYQQAISGTTLLNNGWYNGSAYQKYSFEYIPGTSNGKIAWFVGEDQTFMVDGRAIGQNGNVMERVISEEPMSMVFNLGLSYSWSEILLPDLVFPTIMHIDYVRIYQQQGAESITCDPPGFPTTEYIANHAVAYNNPNLTVSVLPFNPSR
jgi:beta-glucanase (GH16 family)